MITISKASSKIATYEDVRGISDRLVDEIFAGELITHPRSTPTYALAASTLGAELIR